MYFHIYHIRGSFDKFGKFPWNGVTISIWWCDISKDPLFEPLQAKFQPEHSSRLVVIWSEIGAQKSALPSRQRAVPQVNRCNDKTTNWTMNWFLIHPILRIWPRDFFLFSNLKTLKLGSVERNSRQMRKSLPPSMSILQTLRQSISNDYQTCVFSGWNLAWRGSKNGSFEMSHHQMDCSAISWKFIKLIKRPTYTIL